MEFMYMLVNNQRRNGTGWVHNGEHYSFHYTILSTYQSKYHSNNQTITDIRITIT